MKKLQVVMNFEKETKNTFRYKEEGEDNVIGSIYIRKAEFKEKPDTVMLTVEAVVTKGASS